VTPSKSGGVNGINSFDAARVAQHVAGPPNPALNANQLLVADVSNNNSVTSFDAGMIAKFVAGPPYSAPGIGVTATWKFLPASKNYASVTTSITGEDYSALLMGEVSGNWTNSAARPPDNTVNGEDFAGPLRNIAVGLPVVAAEAGKRIVVPVRLENAADKDIISYEFNLRYDPSVIQPIPETVELAGTVSRGLVAIVNAVHPGILRVVVYGAMPIDSDGTLLNLRFVAVGTPGSVTPLVPEQLIFNDGETPVHTTEGRVELFDLLTQPPKES